eukprot:11606728-Alexandrium_andersonii.AAC.1
MQSQPLFDPPPPVVGHTHEVGLVFARTCQRETRRDELSCKYGGAGDPPCLTLPSRCRMAIGRSPHTAGERK